MPDKVHVSASEIATLHDRAIALWHDDPNANPTTNSAFDATVLAQHRANFNLWHTEDRARDPRATDHDIAEVKRAIDRYNQTRNDLAEQCDTMLLHSATAHATEVPHANSVPVSTVPLHSESPGLMIDRLSILALKIFHTQEEINRPNAPAGHTERNRHRLSLLEEQRSDLAHCLDQLWQEVLAGKRRFKIYRQLKMYNDPTLNPSIYKSQP